MTSDADTRSLVDRRHALRLIGGAGLGLALAACGSSGSSGSTAATAGTAATGVGGTAATGASAGAIPEETAGPFPGDGSNGPDILLEDGVVRKDITQSIGSATGVAEGVPLTLRLTVVGADDGAPIDGAAVYVWHCSRDGAYSMYEGAARSENYLRGVQAAGRDGVVEFTSIYPGAYSGRWPHVHFEVYPTVDEATSSAGPMATSQLAFPEDVCNEVYAASAGYEASVQNMSQLSIDGDMVFADGVEHQLATLTGSPSDGYVAELTIPV